MGDFGRGFSGGDLNGNGHFDAGDYEMWRDINKGSSGRGYGGGDSFTTLIAWGFIIAGIILGCVFPPFGILIWIGAKIGA